MKQETPYRDVPALPDTPVIDLISFLGAGRAQGVEIEIGFGKGHFILERAAVVPNARILGIETRRKWVHLVRGRLDKWQRKNAVVYHGDARNAFNRFGPDAVVDRVFIHFPDPWWKARHEKRMVICPELVTEIVRLLKDNGELFVQTDVDFRAEHYRTVLSACDALTPVQGNGFVADNPFFAHSLRETKAANIGLSIFRLHFKRAPR
jgi:tRNA (guanine-N7-)-methyltransferase